MAVIHLETVIDAPLERVFDLARSIEAHQDSAEGTNERPLAGVTSGLLGPEEEVTWEARHLGITQRLRVRMMRLERPRYFQDVMMEGAFHHMQHDHTFAERDGKTVMIDRFEFSSPCGVVGRVFDRLFLKAYMRRLLVTRNLILKQLAESGAWKKYLPRSN